MCNGKGQEFDRRCVYRHAFTGRHSLSYLTAYNASRIQPPDASIAALTSTAKHGVLGTDQLGPAGHNESWNFLSSSKNPI